MSNDRDTFSPEELAIVISHYDVGVIKDVREFRRGSRRSPKLLVSADKGRFLLKRRAKGKDNPYKVAFSHGVQNHLADHGFPLPRLIGTRDENNSMVQYGDNVYELFEFVQAQPYDGSLAQTFASGNTLAKYHAILQDYRSDWDPPRGGFHDANSVRTGLNTLPSSLNSHDSVAGKEAEVLGLVHRLFDAYDETAEQINSENFEDWDEQIVHCDWHPGNMLFEDGNVAAVLDFDAAKLNPRSTDIANGTLQFSIVAGSENPDEWPEYFDEARIRKFLHGYNEHNAIRPEEFRVLPGLMIEALIAEAVLPIAATGSFGRMQGYGFLRMVERKVQWLHENATVISEVLQPK